MQALSRVIGVALFFISTSISFAQEVRSLKPYLVDPLTESWRWGRIRGLESGNLTFVVAMADGSLLTDSDSHRLMKYDGLEWKPIYIPETFEIGTITSLGVSSRDMICVVSNSGIVFHNGKEWKHLTAVGLNRRAWNNILETSDGTLWAGTDSGIARIDTKTGNCQITTTAAPVMSLCEGPEQKSLWVSLMPSGEVWECPLRDGKPAPMVEWIQRHKGLRLNILNTTLMRASDSRIWYINNHHNLPATVYDPSTGFWENVNLSKIGGDNFDFSILETPDSAIWISSRGSLHILKEGQWKVYHSPEFPLPGARSTMVQDNKGSVTIMEASGMHVRIDYGQNQGLSFDGLHYQDEMPNGDLLFISIEDEVVRWDRASDQAEFHSPEETGLTSPGALLVHTNGDWFLTGSDNRQAAVSIFDGTTWHNYAFPKTAISFGHLALKEQPNGDVWVGCAQLESEFPNYEGGIVVFSPKQEGGYSMRTLLPPAYSFRNWSLQQGPSERIYTSGNGLFENTASGAIPIELPDLLRYKWVDQIAVDASGDLWCAVWSLGLFRLRDGEWTRFSDSHGLESKLVSFIICPSGKDLVVTTRNGHYRLDGDRFSPFMGNMAGLHRGSGRLSQGRDGSIWINHTHVDWYYRGQRLEEYSNDKKRGFHTVQYVPDSNPPNTRWITPPAELLRRTNLRFQWEGVDAWSRTPSSQLQYSYRIDGGPWSPFTPANEVVLNDLEGGKHSIEVRSRDTDFNVDPTPLRAGFTIVIPLWQQRWFIISLVAGISLLLAMAVLIVRQRIRHLIEIEQLKMRFFTNISHELKTPLSLILGPVERLQSEISDGHHQHYLSLIKSNSQRLLLLVNQLLDFRKFQLSKLDYKPVEGDLIPFAQRCLSVFDGWLKEKDQDLSFETGINPFIFAFDQEMFHKIIDNLVNNAIKYTPPGGHIRLRIDKVDDHTGTPRGLIEVEDTGPSIPAAEQQAIFEPFFRGTTHGKVEDGSGIGLALVKELVNSIGGDIEVISPVNTKGQEPAGTCFRVRFPLHNSVSQTEPSVTSKQDSDESNSETSDKPIQTQSSIILLIEDNIDLRQFISGELSGLFQVETAENAETGLTKARALIPDIIISDVVMPGHSGFDACLELKKNPHTSHIPVILLTALRSEEHKLKAFHCGADDFITKPVSPELLRLKVNNLLTTQLRTRERVHKQFVETTRISGLSEPDQAFLDKVNALTEEHLSNEQFDVNMLAEQMGFSRSTFYRKFKTLTDLNPAAFIRTKRLRLAARWLAEGQKTVSEIAFDVGFSDAGYFSRVFKDEYNCVPSAFAEKKNLVDASID